MTQQTSTIELEAKEITFFSPGDEAAFFGWLKQLPCVEKVEGRGRTLYVSVDKSGIDEDGLRELLALFLRFGVSMSQLRVFDCNDFTDWFRSDTAYWYKDVFVEEISKKPRE